MEFGIHSFGDTARNPVTGITISARDRLHNFIEEAVLADQVGLDVFGAGEHHRPDYAISAPAIVLAAIAARTRRIRLTSAVTVLSSEDPVRVFQQFATLDLISDGRAEIIAGRGSFIESFPLFGYGMDDYDTLFSQKLDLLLKLRDNERVTWKGKHRAALSGQGVYPRPLQPQLPVWIGVGGNPESVIRAGRLGLPMALAIIGGFPERFVPLADLYRNAGAEAGHPPESLRLSINSHGLIGPDGESTAHEAWPGFQETMNRIGGERGWPPTTRVQFDATRGPTGALVIGSPQEVIDKILYQHELFRIDRFMLYPGWGSIEHAQTLRTIELFGTVVAPAVRKALDEKVG
jgi:probable LLM family oxidoreductase